VFVRDPSFRANLVQALNERNQPDAAALIPAGRPDAQHFEIVYAVLGEKAPNVPEPLPFFSQLTCQLTAERLENLNYRVSLRQIPSEA
jgi:uncharacterized protein (TIGR04141 family)